MGRQKEILLNQMRDTFSIEGKSFTVYDKEDEKDLRRYEYCISILRNLLNGLKNNEFDKEDMKDIYYIMSDYLFFERRYKCTDKLNIAVNLLIQRAIEFLEKDIERLTTEKKLIQREIILIKQGDK